MDTQAGLDFSCLCKKKGSGSFDSLPIGKLCMLLSFADFLNLYFREKIRKTIGMGYSVDPDHDQRSVGHDLALNHLKMLSADDKSPRKQVTTDFRLSCDVAQMRGLIKCDIKCPSYNSKR